MNRGGMSASQWPSATDMAKTIGERGAPSWRWRPLARRLHRWFGLLAVLWLLPLALTGSAITFYDELDRWLNPDWRTVAASDAPPALDRALAAASQHLPGFTARFLDRPNRADESITIVGSAPIDGGEVVSVQLFADPRDGSLLGWRETEVLSFDRRHLMDTLYALHMDLMLGPVMVWILGLMALFWIIDHIIATALSFPALAKWRASFAVAGRGFSLRWLFDLHRAGGLWLFAITFVLAVTSLTLTWHEETRDATRLLVPVSDRLHYAFPVQPVTAPVIGVEQAVALAGGTVDSVVLLHRYGVYGVRRFDERDMDGYGRLWVYVSMTDGRLLGSRHDRGQGAGDLFFAWQYPLHSGKGLGLPGRILVLLAGLATAGLCITGLWLWWRRR